jgi:POTRA domain, ShlB-type
MLLLGGSWVVMPGPVLAQAPANLNLVPQGSPIPRVLPPAVPSTAPGTALPALPPPGGEMPNRTVHVIDVTVDGVTAFPVAEIERYAQDLTGPAVPLPKIDAARQAMLQHYRSAGYVLSTVSANLVPRVENCDPMPPSRGKRLSRLGPLEWLCHGPVEVVDEALDPLPEVLLRGEAATPQQFACEDREPNLDLIQPRRMLGGKTKADPVGLRA